MWSIMYSLMVQVGAGEGIAEDVAELLFDVAALTGGYEIADAAAFAAKVTKLMGATEIPAKKEEKVEAVEAEIVE